MQRSKGRSSPRGVEAGPQGEGFRAASVVLCWTRTGESVRAKVEVKGVGVRAALRAARVQTLTLTDPECCTTLPLGASLSPSVNWG